MTNFTDFTIIFDNLVEYFTGNYAILAGAIILIFLLTLLAAGLDVRYSTIFALPLVAFFVMIGWFGIAGASSWIINLGLIIVSVFYAFAVIKLSG